jgi:hypothetical protein
VSGLKGHSVVLRPREPDKMTPHALFLSYQPEPGAKMLAPEIYPRPTGGGVHLWDNQGRRGAQ